MYDPTNVSGKSGSNVFRTLEQDPCTHAINTCMPSRQFMISTASFWTFFSCSLAGHGVANQMQRWSMLWDFYATMPIAVRTKCFVHCLIHVKMALACMYIFLNNMSKILLQKLTVKPTTWCRAVILGSFNSMSTEMLLSAVLPALRVSCSHTYLYIYICNQVMNLINIYNSMKNVRAVFDLIYISIYSTEVEDDVSRSSLGVVLWRF